MAKKMGPNDIGKLLVSMNFTHDIRLRASLSPDRQDYVTSLKRTVAIINDFTKTGTMDDCLDAMDSMLTHDLTFLAQTDAQTKSYQQNRENLEKGRKHYEILKNRPDEYGRFADGFVDRNRLVSQIPKDGLHDALRSYTRQLNSRESSYLIPAETELIKAQKELVAEITRRYEKMQREILGLEGESNKARQEVQAQDSLLEQAKGNSRYEQLAVDKTRDVHNRLEMSISKTTERLDAANSDLNRLTTKPPGKAARLAKTKAFKQWNQTVKRTKLRVSRATSLLKSLNTLKKDTSRMKDKISKKLEKSADQTMREQHQQVVKERERIQKEQREKAEEERRKGLKRVVNKLTNKGQVKEGGRGGRSDLPPL